MIIQQSPRKSKVQLRFQNPRTFTDFIRANWKSRLAGLFSIQITDPSPPQKCKWQKSSNEIRIVKKEITGLLTER